DQLSDQHLQAKRARVESIIQGMSLPPTPQAFGTGLEAAFGHERESGGEMPCEGKRKPKVPQQGLGLAGRLKEQLCLLEQQLKWLQEKFSQVCDSGDAAQAQEGAKKVHPLPGKPGDRGDRGSSAATSDMPKLPLWRSILEMHGPEKEEDGGDLGGLPSAARVLSQVLKHELAGVTSQAVDSVLKSLWAASHLLQQHRSLPVPETEARREYFAAGKCRKPPAKPPSTNTPGLLGSPHTEAPSGALGTRKSTQASSMGYSLGSGAPAQENQLLSQLLGYSQHGLWDSGSYRSPSALERGPAEPLDLPWGTIKLRSSVVRQQQQHPLPLSSGDIESPGLLPVGRDGHGELQAAMDEAPLSLTPRQMQEALTPGHLKKAKLMFFFTRYPSSTLLKTYFLDVQFSRCITSQLIKWFSNFREFYYIQVEKFARQAVLEGVVDASTLHVSRDSELFRALNMHYNKGNDFEVPGRFLEVASLTLREFFSAVRAGKDTDPSWKKPIYKIISKLDSDIPEGFKAASCSQEL
ncbi:Prospero homeobox protein 2, partial [Colius striatus]